MLRKIKFILWLMLDFFDELAILFVVGGCWMLASSAWLAAFALDKMAGDEESMSALANRLAEATEKVADRTRKAASRDS